MLAGLCKSKQFKLGAEPTQGCALFSWTGQDVVKVGAGSIMQELEVKSLLFGSFPVKSGMILSNEGRVLSSTSGE